MTPSRPTLPIDSHHDELLAALRDNPVVVVAGDTGSGKTTRIPPLCLELGIPATKLVGCTQPRRVAAVSVAERVALERGTPIGTEIGWQHRFGQALSERTRVKFMTDGILLAETRGDPELRRYAVVMVDEAHERTLNIDFLLGYLKRLLPRRPELRVIVSSATLDVRRFADFFRDALPARGGVARREVPVIEIPGRVHPVEVRYRPDADEDADLAQRVADGVEELWTSADGDILVFLPGERDIREAEEAVGRLGLPDTDVLPFMASLPPADQRRVFHPVPGRRRVVLSTNVAETSLTIPGIRMVVDSGLARINRYSPRSKVERLHIEPISQASAEQRKGRCGRLGPGICLRLYSEEDFQKRPAYTEPELRRSALDGVILSMADLRLGPVERFPFLDPPGSGAIREGVRTLVELGAIRDDGRLTALGRAMVRYPVEPRLARMVLAGHESGHEQTLSDVLTIVAALATEDPRLRPLDKKDEADLKHAQFRTKGGDDYDAILRLWRWFHDLPSRTAQRRQCKDNYLSFRRFQEWEDVRGELARRPFVTPPVSSTGKREDRKSEKREDGGSGKPALLRALLTGLLSQIGHRDPEEGDYRGPNGVRFTIHPGSALAKHGPDWIMAAELVDTSRLFARRCASIDVDWIEPLAAPLCKYSYHSPFWDERAGTARALERVVFRGLTIHDGRRRDYSRIDPDFSREMFVRHGLVQGALPGAVPAFVRDNLALFESIRDAHRKLREPEDTDDEAFVALYLERLPRECVNLPALRQWMRQATPEEARHLLFRREDFAAPEDDPSAFPEKIRLDGHLLRLSYRNEEGAEDDGITCTLGIDAIPSLCRWRSDWLVPGALPRKLDWMLSRLTRAESRPLPPRAQLSEELPALLGTPDRPLDQALRRLLRERWGVVVREGLWGDDALPDHLKVRFRVLDARHQEVFVTRDPEELAKFLAEYRRLLREGGAAAGAPRDVPGGRVTADSLTLWPWGALPESAEVGNAGWTLRNYPALTEEEDGAVALRWYADKAEAAAKHHAGVRRLYVLALCARRKSESARVRGFESPGSTGVLRSLADLRPGLGFGASEAGSAGRGALGRGMLPDGGLAADAMQAAVDGVLLPPTEPVPRDEETFLRRLAERQGAVGLAAREQARLASDAQALAEERRAALAEAPLPPETLDDLAEQLDWLVFPGFARVVPRERLCHYGRYFEAMRLRMERARQNPARDAERMAVVRGFWERYTEAVAKPGLAPEEHRALGDIRWAIEELRVSLFAQELRTPAPVSAQRIERMFAAVGR